jgi:hypothetical protein
MTTAGRVAALVAQGYTPRQAAFLVRVMLHSGFCMPRQYCAFAGIARGQNVAEFFGRLVSRRCATPYPCGHNKARIYHLHGVKLYEAIGQRDVRFRRRSSLPRAIEGLMLLDHVIAHPGLSWLGTENDKLAHFLTATPLRKEQLPKLVFGQAGQSTTRFFPDKVPVGVTPDGRHYVFVHLATAATAHDFRAFLRRHAEVFRVLTDWSVRLLVPRHLRACLPQYEHAFSDELVNAVMPRVADELRWYFKLAPNAPPPDRTRLLRARRVFGSAKFRALRRAWEVDGDRAIDMAASSGLRDAIERGEGRLECLELSRQYLHLSPLVGSS